MQPLLNVLDNLSSVIESAALDHMGEGRFELQQLCEMLESGDDAYAIPDRQQVLTRLQECLALYQARENYGASSRMTQLSRKLWHQLRETMDGNEGN